MIFHVQFITTKGFGLPGKWKVWGCKSRSTNGNGVLPLAVWLCGATWEAAILGFLETSWGEYATHCIYAKPSC